MTDLVMPPDDAAGQIAWARSVLRDFPPGSGIVSARAIRAMARAILREHGAAPGSGANHARRRSRRSGDGSADTGLDDGGRYDFDPR